MKVKRTRVWTDPVVEEVRAVRRALWERGGGTASGYLKLVRQLAAASGPARPKRGTRARPRPG
jgi:hypothetical protein